MFVLGVETSCDDTAAALYVVRQSSPMWSRRRIIIHSPYGGVVPELASRQHIRSILPIVDGARREDQVTLQAIDGFAVTYGPGLVGSLLVGICLVKGISFRRGIPFVGINHLEAHLLAIHLEHDVSFPYIALIASGGHTLSTVPTISATMLTWRHARRCRREAFDKVAKMMGLGYPGGRVIGGWRKPATQKRSGFRGRD